MPTFSTADLLFGSFNGHTAMPVQTIPTSKKNKKWQESCVLAIIGFCHWRTHSIGTPIRMTSEDKDTCYRLLTSDFKESDLLNIINETDNNVAKDLVSLNKIRNINTLKPIIDHLTGEELKRPFNYSVYAISGKIRDEEIQKRYSLLSEAFVKNVINRLKKQGAAQLEEGEDPEALIDENLEIIEQDLKAEKNNTEIQMSKFLKSAEAKFNFKEIFNEGFLDMLITSEAHFHIDPDHHKPIRLVNNMQFGFETNPIDSKTEEASYCCEEQILTADEVISEYGEFFTEKELENFQTNPAMSTELYATPFLNVSSFETEEMIREGARSRRGFIGTYAENSGFLVRVYKVYWKSKKPIKVLGKKDKDTDEFIKYSIEDEDYELPKNLKNKGFSVITEWVDEVWQGHYALNKTFDVKRCRYQLRNTDNLAVCYLPYIGRVFSNRNANAVSLVHMLKPLVYLKLAVFSKLELEISKAKGKILTVDIAKIPNMFKTFPEWFKMLTESGINVINTAELKDKNLSGDNNYGNYNQYKDYDLSLSNSVMQYINIMQYIDSQIKMITGVSDQRLGTPVASENATLNNMSLTQSYTISDKLFFQYNNLKSTVLKFYLKAVQQKAIYDSNIETVSVSKNGFEKIKIDGEVFEENQFEITVSDSNNENYIMRKLEPLIEYSLQQDTVTISELIAAYRTNSVAEMEQILGKANERKQQLLEKQQEQQTQMQQAQIESKNQELQMQMEKYQMDKEFEAQQNDLDRQNRIEIAMINANSKLQPETQPEPIDNSLEISKLEQDKISKQNELSLKEKEFQLKALSEKAKLTANEAKLLVDLKKSADALKIAEENKNKYDNKNKK